MKNILVPLADNEDLRLPQLKNVNYITLHTSEINEEKYKHIFYSEVGKYLDSIQKMAWRGIMIKDQHFSLDSSDIFGVSQNRRFFRKIQTLSLTSKNEVILASEEELGGFSIIGQFKACHPIQYEIFNEICEKLKIKKESLNSGRMSPHNIFLSHLNFFLEYREFLIDTLSPYFDERSEEKIGAWISERLLHFFAHKYYKVRMSDITTLEKINR